MLNPVECRSSPCDSLGSGIIPGNPLSLKRKLVKAPVSGAKANATLMSFTPPRYPLCERENKRMKLRIPFIYYADVVPKGARKARNMQFGEYVEAEVREVADFDAPVALRWEADRYGRGGIDGFHERRWFEGKLWEPSIYYYSGRPNVHINARSMADATAKGYRHSPLIHSYEHHFDRLFNGLVGPLVPSEHREVLSSEREEQLFRTLTAADGTLIVDGKVWVESYEPVYRISDSGGFQRYIRLEVIKPPTEERQQEGVFRLDRFEDLVAYAMDKFGEEIDEDRRVQVLVPEAVSYDDEYPSLLAGLRSAVESQRSDIGSRPTPEIMAWAEMRDAVAAMGASPDGRAIEAAIRATEAWMAATEVNDYWKERPLTAIGRWNVRPIQMGEDEEDVPSFRP